MLDVVLKSKELKICPSPADFLLNLTGSLSATLSATFLLTPSYSLPLLIMLSAAMVLQAQYRSITYIEFHLKIELY